MTTARTERDASHQPATWLHIGLWIVQGLLALIFAGGGFWKLTTPISKLAATMPWMGQVSPRFLYGTAIIDILGGLGIILPSITRIKPRLTVLAALGCILLQMSAIAFHVKRKEASDTPFNVFLVVLSLFVAWGREFKAPIIPRM